MGRERLKFLPQASHGSPQVYVKIIHLMIINKLNHLLVTNLINLMVVKKGTAVIMVAKMGPRGAGMFSIITKNIPVINQITSQNLLFQGGTMNGIPQQVIINLMVIKKVTAVIMVAKMVPRGAVMFITKNIPEMNQITSQNLLFQGGSINGIPQQVSVGEKVMRSLTSQNEKVESAGRPTFAGAPPRRARLKRWSGR